MVLLVRACMPHLGGPLQLGQAKQDALVLWTVVRCRNPKYTWCQGTSLGVEAATCAQITLEVMTWDGKSDLEVLALLAALAALRNAGLPLGQLPWSGPCLPCSGAHMVCHPWIQLGASEQPELLPVSAQLLALVAWPPMVRLGASRQPELLPVSAQLLALVVWLACRCRRIWYCINYTHTPRQLTREIQGSPVAACACLTRHSEGHG